MRVEALAKSEVARQLAEVEAKNPPHKRAVKDMLVMQLSRDGMPLEQISALDGRTTGTIKQVLKKNAARDPGDLIRGVDPVREVDGILERSKVQWRLAADRAAQASNDAIFLGALKAMSAADDRMLKLLQAMDMLPRDLVHMRAMRDFKQLAHEMTEKLRELADGDLELEEVLAYFSERSGLSPTTLGLESGEDDVEDAEVVSD